MIKEEKQKGKTKVVVDGGKKSSDSNNGYVFCGSNLIELDRSFYEMTTKKIKKFSYSDLLDD